VGSRTGICDDLRASLANGARSRPQLFAALAGLGHDQRAVSCTIASMAHRGQIVRMAWGIYALPPDDRERAAGRLLAWARTETGLDATQALAYRLSWGGWEVLVADDAGRHLRVQVATHPKVDGAMRLAADPLTLADLVAALEVTRG